MPSTGPAPEQVPSDDLSRSLEPSSGKQAGYKKQTARKSTGCRPPSNWPRGARLSMLSFNQTPTLPPIPNTPTQETSSPALLSPVPPAPSIPTTTIRPAHAVGAKKHKQLGPSYRKHADFFYEGATVGIICGRTVFKVDKQLLSQASPDLATAFLEPGFSAVGEGFSVDPAYTVKVDGVSFGHLMAILYHANDWMVTPPSFKVLASVLRVSLNLNFPRIRQWALKTIKAIWAPDTSAVILNPLSHADAVDAILFARLCNIPQIMKRALYEIVRSPQYDARIVYLQNALSSDDMFLALHLRSRLSDSWLSEMQAPPVQMLCTHCTFAPGASPKALSTFWTERVQKSGLLLEYRHDPISGIDAVVKSLNLAQEGLCARCFENVKEWVRGRQDAWWTMIDSPAT
ncbi:hypothetical protein OF83DRAFT_409971 [Amylostereum chailletii]|nr:hypothetical protein OF83DRAFT_409971 [Amylostereum chailletii]